MKDKIQRVIETAAKNARATLPNDPDTQAAGEVSIKFIESGNGQLLLMEMAHMDEKILTALAESIIVAHSAGYADAMYAVAKKFALI